MSKQNKLIFILYLYILIALNLKYMSELIHTFNLKVSCTLNLNIFSSGILDSFN